MKKILAALLLLLVLSPLSYSYDLSNSDIQLVNKLSNIILQKSKSDIDTIITSINTIVTSNKYDTKTEALLMAISTQISPKKDIETPIISTPDNNLENIDYSFVKNNWLTWNNEVRTDLGLKSYTVNPILEKSADKWSKQAKEKSNISHKRNPEDGFYDYNNINAWFKDEGVVCKNISAITHTENIWWGGYTCTDGECSSELSEGIKKGFDAYMAEKGTDSDAHYRSLTQPYFTQIGVGISVDEVKQNYFEYYLTIHYCTELLPSK